MVELAPETQTTTDVQSPAHTPAATAYLVFDTESVPDGRLLREVKYSGQSLSDEEAIERAQKEARETSWTGSDFLPPSFQIPISICVAKLGKDFGLQSFQCLGAPEYQTP